VVLTVLSITLAFFLHPYFGLVALLYFLLNIYYSYALKHLVIIDVMTIAVGFVLRAIAGAVVIEVHFSLWLILCTFLLALFLGLNKRRHELTLLTQEAAQHRQILEEYSPYFLDLMINVVTASTVIAYALYTMAEETIEKFQTDKLIFTTPFVMYGIFRYLYLVHQRGRGGNPTRILLTDRPLKINLILWILVAGVMIYL
jgi:4-hydroxybenzoate polyprenyltransferase